MKLSTRFANAKQQKHVLARVITCSLLLLLPSCAIPRLRQTDLGLGLPSSFNGAASEENSAQLRVDEFYNDPLLTQLVCQAVATNRELKILEEEIQIARNEILARRGAYLPFIGFRSGAGLEKPSLFTPAGAAENQLLDANGKGFPDPMGNFLASFNLFWQLDIWRELRNARDAAIQRYFAAIEKRNYFVTQMVADIADNYYALMALDMRLITLDGIIEFQQRSLEIAKANLDAGRDNDLPVQRFTAEVRKNQSEKLIVRQEIIEAENRINFLTGRVPQAVERNSANFYDVNLRTLNVGVPAQLLLNRPDIRQAERELAATGLDIKVARAHFFPRIDLSAGVGYQAFNPKYIFNPEALIYNVAGDLTAPVINRAAIRAEYLTANARQLASIYNYQRIILNAVTEVVNRLSKVENYSSSLTVKRQQLSALESAVGIANRLFGAGRTQYLDVLFSQRDLLEARTVFIATKREQLSAIVNTYQALGGGASVSCPPSDQPMSPPMAQMPPRLMPEVQQAPPPRELKEPGGLPPLPAIPGMLQPPKSQ